MPDTSGQQIDAKHLIAVLRQQRNTALDTVAELSALASAQAAQITDLSARLAQATEETG